MEGYNLVWDGSDNRVRSVDSTAHEPTDTTQCAQTIQGSCHCKKVMFSVRVEKSVLQILDCNCGVCAKKGYLHLIVPKESVCISEDSLNSMTTYRFGTSVASHTFCSTCGVQALYVPRSNPDCYDVNARCLQLEGRVSRIKAFEGKNFTGTLDIDT